MSVQAQAEDNKSGNTRKLENAHRITTAAVVKGKDVKTGRQGSGEMLMYRFGICNVATVLPPRFYVFTCLCTP